MCLTHKVSKAHNHLHYLHQINSSRVVHTPCRNSDHPNPDKFPLVYMPVVHSWSASIPPLDLSEWIHEDSLPASPSISIRWKFHASLSRGLRSPPIPYGRVKSKRSWIQRIRIPRSPIQAKAKCHSLCRWRLDFVSIQYLCLSLLSPIPPRFG